MESAAAPASAPTSLDMSKLMDAGMDLLAGNTAKLPDALHHAGTVAIHRMKHLTTTEKIIGLGVLMVGVVLLAKTLRNDQE